MNLNERALGRVRIVLILGFGFSPFAESLLPACSCITEGVKADLDHSTVVFRGIVKGVKAFPVRPESKRPRYAVTFAASEYWKGNRSKEITLHILDPGTDCIGAHFVEGKEYVVFAISQAAKDYKLGEVFWYGWLDVLQKGTSILTVNNYCDSTSEVASADKTLKALGQGEKPKF